MKALLIIDTQNDFMPGGSLAVPKGDLIIPAINASQAKVDLVIATQDWHPANHKSFASNHPNKQVFDTISLQGREQILWPNHCVQGTVGAQFHPELETRPIAAIFRKGMNPEIDSYSGFYDNDHQQSTGLAGFLREKKVTQLYFAGLCADICVYFTIQDALAAGFSCLLIEEATAAFDKGNFEKIRAKLVAQAVSIVHVTEI